jgi:hypothetical protein
MVMFHKANQISVNPDFDFEVIFINSSLWDITSHL